MILSHDHLLDHSQFPHLHKTPPAQCVVLGDALLLTTDTHQHSELSIPPMAPTMAEGDVDKAVVDRV